MKTQKMGFTLVELIGVIVVIVVLIGLLFPLIQKKREAHRIRFCTNQMKLIALAIHNYHDTHINAIPPGGQVYVATDNKRANATAKRLSGFVALLPFSEQSALYSSLTAGKFYFTLNGDTLLDDSIAGSGQDAAGQKVAGTGGYATASLDRLLCPSDGGGKSKDANDQSRTNYRFCFGDYPVHSANMVTQTDGNVPNAIGTADTDICNVNRGAFGMHTWNGMSRLMDGTSNTLFISERVIATNTAAVRQGYYSTGSAAGAIGSFKNTVPDSGTTMNLSAVMSNYKGTWSNLHATNATTRTAWSGKRWMDGAVVYTGFVTILPPNGPSPTGTNDFEGALVTASSNHPGGVNAAMADASVKFFSDTIDYQGTNGKADNNWQNAYTSGKSAHGVWGALGSRNGGEAIAP